MKKCIKVLLAVSFGAAVAFGQTADSARQSSPAPVVKPTLPIMISLPGGTKYISNVRPTTKTNWSKIKDLFL
jgi:hypothetical protein